ncbi:MAG: hypothetical protein ACM3SX_12750 [Deltaproteobacteria bacterium]
MKTRLIHVDIDSPELGRNCPPTLGMIADAKSVSRTAGSCSGHERNRSIVRAIL